MNFEVDPAAGLSQEERSSFDTFILEFEEHWSPDALPQFCERLATLSGRLAESLLREMILIDIERQWHHGIAVTTEEYLREYPDLGGIASVPLGLVVAEIEARAATGKALDPDEFLTRFPSLATELEPALQSGSNADTRVIESGDTSRSHDGAPGVASRAGRSKLPEEFGRYRILRRIADGGMGSVYLATDTSLYDRRVALKVPHFSGGSPQDLECKTRFFAEARAASRLDEHPNLCSIYEIGRVDGVDYIAMMYVEGETLESHVRSRGQIDHRQSAALVAKIAEAIGYAHRRGIIHRDLKLANIMLSSLGEPVVMDFGLARLVSENESTRLTQYGALIGTPAYMSPEQVRADPDEIHASTDIYSLGVVLYHLLTGRLPFQGSLGSILSGVLRDPPVPPSEYASGLDPALEAICMRMTSKHAGDRYGSMDEVATALGTWLQPPRNPEHERRSAIASVKSQTGLIAATAMLLLLALLSMVLIVRFSHAEVRFEIEQSDIGVIIDGDRFKLQELREPKQLSIGSHQLAIEIGGTQVPLDRSFTIETVEFQGRAKLAVELDGASVTADHFNVSRGKEHVMRVALIDLKPSPTPSPSATGDPIANSVTMSPQHTSETALEFNGVDSYVAIPTFRYDGTHPITIESWLRLPKLKSNPTDARPGVISQNDGRGVNLLLMERGFFQAGAAGCGNVIADRVAATDRWAHVAVTYDHPTLQLFVDGRLLRSRTATVPFRPGDKDFIIAADPTTSTDVSRHLRGLVDEVRFSNVVRYRDHFTPSTRHEIDSETILLYHFDHPSNETARDATGNGFDGIIHRARVVPGDEVPPGFDREDASRFDSIQRFERFDTAYDAVAGTVPTAIKEFKNSFRSDGGESSTRWHADGHLKIETSGGAKAWNALSVQRGLLEVTGRSVSTGSSWMVNLTNIRLRRGIKILVRSDGQILSGKSLFQLAPEVADQPLTQIAAASTNDFNAIGIAVHQRAFQVFWDGTAISDLIKLDYDLTPCAVSLGNQGDGRVEFDAVRYWRPFDTRETANGPDAEAESTGNRV